MTSTALLEVNGKDFVQVIKRLSALLQEEVVMMKDMKLAQLHKLHDEKIRLTSVLEEYKEILSANPSLLKEIPNDVLSQMRSETKQFEAVVENQGVHLRKIKEVHRIIMEAVRTVIGNKIAASSNYTKKGQVDLDKKKMKNIPAVSIYKTV